MRNWNYIFIRYCDGWSFAGNVDKPQIAQKTNKTTHKVTNVTVNIRGRAVLDAVIADLLEVRGMKAATNLVVGGCSVGVSRIFNQRFRSIYPSCFCSGTLSDCEIALSPLE
jgi:hypothetical protein